MRVTLALAAAALAFASTAHANNPPLAAPKPISLSAIHVIKFGPRAEQQVRSCLANGVTSRGAVGRIARKLFPVACEQPPRSRLAIIALVGG
jgi:hypothetical protein